MSSSIFGASKVPKDAHRDYERFVQAVSAAMGSQLTSAELNEAVPAVWAAVKSAARPEEAVKRRITTAGLQKDTRCDYYWVSCSMLCV